MNTGLLLPVAFLAGLLGSGHCFGMCGSIVVLLENSQAPREKFQGLLRRLIYNTGRLLFYMLLGAVAGSAGIVLSKITGVEAALGILRLIAATLVIALGLNLLLNLRVLQFLEKGGAVLWRQLSPLARYVLPISTPLHALGAGFIWGALPCGLVYSGVAIAASSGDAISGMLLMLAFWLGTLPALLLVGTSANKLNSWTRLPALRHLAGAVLLGIGVLALATPYIHSDEGAHQSHSHSGAA